MLDWAPVLLPMRPGEWTLVRGQMMSLHAIEEGVSSHVPDLQLLDPALLLSLVGDPIVTAEQLTRKDHQRLRCHLEMADVDARAWASLPSDAANRAGPPTVSSQPDERACRKGPACRHRVVRIPVTGPSRHDQSQRPTVRSAAVSRIAQIRQDARRCVASLMRRK